MGLLSIFSRNKQAAAAPGKTASPGRAGRSPARQAPLASTRNPGAADALRDVRARARTRLMGATVLLLAGVIGFPLLFETQPRPVPVDLPIEIPARNAPGVVDASSHAGAHATPAAATRAASAPAVEPVSYDARPSAPAAASAAASQAGDKSAFAALATPPAPAASRASGAAEKAAYVAPSMGGKGASAKPADTAAGRFVVQVGAFLDDAKVRDARSKVEKLGMKTYTQPVDTPTGRRIRVRIGPYATRAEADKAAARIKAEGQQAVVLSL